MKKLLPRLLLVVIAFIAFPSVSEAVLPPNILFSIGSQISQVVSTIGIVLAGSFVALAPFKNKIIEKVKQLTHSRIIVIIFTFIIALAVGSVATFFVLLKNRFLPVNHQPQQQVLQAGQYRYFSDRFVIISKGESADQNILIDLIISRKENEQGNFIHYYITNSIDGKKREKTYNQKDAPGHEVLNTLLFSKYQEVEAPDNSARQQFSFDVRLMGKTYHLTTPMLDSDFIIKNDPEYTSYASVGEGTLVQGSRTIPVHIFHQAAYSTDYRPTVFFDERDELRSETTQLFLWNKEGDFILVDKSHVLDPIPAYTSHFWGLSKDATGTLEKAFDGEVTKNKQGEKVSFMGSIPGFDTISFKVDLKKKFSDELDKGWIEGTMTKNNSTSSVYGLGYNFFYGKEK